MLWVCYRPNVALTRAKNNLVVFGSQSTLSSSKIWLDLMLGSEELTINFYFIGVDPESFPGYKVLDGNQVSANFPLSQVINERIGRLIGCKEPRSAVTALGEFFNCEIGLEKMSGVRGEFRWMDRFRKVFITSRKSESICNAVGLFNILCILLLDS